MTTGTYHEPVLLKESVDALDIKPDGCYADVTFGGGGHSREILRRLGKKGKLIAFDQDADAQRNTITDERFVLVQHNYRYMQQFLRYYHALPLDGMLADLGISSYQVDEAARGFSIRFDAALDMRMNQSLEKTAADLVNTMAEPELVEIFSAYGEVRNARTLARKIVEERGKGRIETIGQFRDAIRTCVDRQHENQYYAKVFQSLRIAVNDELGALKELLVQAPASIGKGGKMVVITYHSLEDRLVKNFIQKGLFEGEAQKDLYGNIPDLPFQSVHRKPVLPGDDEVARNPRARSAKMRVAERT